MTIFWCLVASFTCMVILVYLAATSPIIETDDYE